LKVSCIRIDCSGSRVRGLFYRERSDSGGKGKEQPSGGFGYNTRSRVSEDSVAALKGIPGSLITGGSIKSCSLQGIEGGRWRIGTTSLKRSKRMFL
jgi:hypothetical protein